MHSFHGGHGHGYGYDMDMAMDMIKVLRPSNDLDIHDRNFVILYMDFHCQIELTNENWKVLILCMLTLQ